MKHLTSRLVWLVAAALVVASPAAAQSRIAVVDTTGVTVLDTTTGQERAHFPLQLDPGEVPNAITVTPDGGRLLVTTTSATSGGFPNLLSFLHVLDASTGDRLARISTPWSRGKAVVLPDGSRAFLTGAIASDTLNQSALNVVDLTS